MPKHTYGLVHDRHDDRDLRFSSVANKLGLVSLPPKVDLRPVCSPVRDQGDLGSCTGFASAVGFREALLNDAKKPFVPLSPLYVYYWERQREKSINVDSGATIRSAMKVLAKFGAAPEALWPYDISKFRDRPSDISIVQGKQYAISKYHRVNNVIEMKQALSIHHPIVIGIEVWESFESDEVASTGIVPIPDEQKEAMLGGHAVCVVGYDDALRSFIIKNSWGTSWGQGGYCLIPYAYFNPNLKLVMDMWTGKA